MKVVNSDQLSMSLSPLRKAADLRVVGGASPLAGAV